MKSAGPQGPWEFESPALRHKIRLLQHGPSGRPGAKAPKMCQNCVRTPGTARPGTARRRPPDGLPEGRRRPQDLASGRPGYPPTAVYRLSLGAPGLYIARSKQGQVVEYGPLWSGKNELTMHRTVAIVRAWFSLIRDGAREVWDLGSADGGGLAMNDGVTVCVNVLRSVFQHLEGKGRKLISLADRELVEILSPYAKVLGQHFGTMNAEETATFRSLRGNQGQTNGTRRCQEALRRFESTFDPPGLAEFLEAERTHNTRRGVDIISRIEVKIQKTVLDELMREFGSKETDWFFEGVPKTVRKKVDDRINEEQGRSGGREQNFDFIDYREIAVSNWSLFENILADGKGNKEARTRWIVEVNDIRKRAVHASKGTSLPVTGEQLASLEERWQWLRQKVSGAGDPG